jgi:hypothetical protein
MNVNRLVARWQMLCKGIASTLESQRRLIKMMPNMIYLECSPKHAVTFLPRHCEAKPKVYSKLMKLATAASPKQSPCSDFAVTWFYNPCKALVSCLVKRDCRVACSLQNHTAYLVQFTAPSNAPRNDEVKNMSESVMARSSTLIEVATK